MEASSSGSQGRARARRRRRRRAADPADAGAGSGDRSGSSLPSEPGHIQDTCAAFYIGDGVEIGVQAMPDSRDAEAQVGTSAVSRGMCAACQTDLHFDTRLP
eukprot:8715657-Alexandrium_andersonii.AAC.1